jgi:hypothetical protein
MATPPIPPDPLAGLRHTRRAAQRAMLPLLAGAILLGAASAQAYSASASTSHSHASSHFSAPAPQGPLVSRSNPFGGETWNNGARSQRNVLGGYDYYDRHGRLRLICRSNPFSGQTCLRQ